MQTVQGEMAAPAPLLDGGSPPHRNLVRKGDFAQLRGVTPGRVSQWIAAGQISGDAIVGEGRTALIDVDLACQQLGVTLDAIQLSAQARPIPQPARPAGAELPTPPAFNDAQQRTLLARAEQAEINARQARREEEAQQGVYIRTEDARREFSKVLTEVMSSIEELMPTLGDALAAELKIDGKAATVILRRQLRAWRERQSTAARQIADREPKLVDEEETGDA